MAPNSSVTVDDFLKLYLELSCSAAAFRRVSSVQLDSNFRAAPHAQRPRGAALVNGDLEIPA